MCLWTLITMHNMHLPQREALQEAVRRLLSSGEKDYWTLNTVFAVDEFSFVESLVVSLVDWTPSDHDPQY